MIGDLQYRLRYTITADNGATFQCIIASPLTKHQDYRNATMYLATLDLSMDP